MKRDSELRKENGRRIGSNNNQRSKRWIMHWRRQREGNRDPIITWWSVYSPTHLFCFGQRQLGLIDLALDIALASSQLTFPSGHRNLGLKGRRRGWRQIRSMENVRFDGTDCKQTEPGSWKLVINSVCQLLNQLVSTMAVHAMDLYLFTFLITVRWVAELGENVKEFWIRICPEWVLIWN